MVYHNDIKMTVWERINFWAFNRTFQLSYVQIDSILAFSVSLSDKLTIYNWFTIDEWSWQRKYVNSSSISIEYVIISCKNHPILVNTFLTLTRYEIHLILA